MVPTLLCILEIPIRKREILETATAIILKTFVTGSCKVSAFTHDHGKILLTVLDPTYARRARVGSTIAYAPRRFAQESYITDRISLIAQPLLLHEHDLAWQHHLLELTYYFAPLYQTTPEVYQLLQHSLFSPLRQQLTPEEHAVLHLLTIGSLLTIFGHYPPTPFTTALASTKQLLTTTVDIPPATYVELLRCYAPILTTQATQSFHGWLLDCIKGHPRASSFKTVPFVYNRG